ncbi:hypothetical protein KR018_003175, partial [Drosophila ironensis]
KMTNSACNSSMRAVVETTHTSLREVFSKYQAKMSKASMEAIRSALSKSQRQQLLPSRICIKEKHHSLWKEEVATICLVVFIFLSFLLLIYLIRVYHHTKAYGEGGCLSTGLWSNEECQIIF